MDDFIHLPLMQVTCSSVGSILAEHKFKSTRDFINKIFFFYVLESLFLNICMTVKM